MGIRAPVMPQNQDITIVATDNQVARRLYCHK